MTWTEFCQWLVGKPRRVVSEHDDDIETTLTFDDGSVAVFASHKTSGTPRFSEWTPGSSGHLTTPTVHVTDADGETR